MAASNQRRVPAVVLPAPSHQTYSNGPRECNQPRGQRNGDMDFFRDTPSQPRLLTVDQALQFSPLSSVVPFSPDIIPLPNADVQRSSSIFSSPSERQRARQSLDVLDQEVTRGSGKSAVTQCAQEELKSLLGPETINYYKFKTPSRIHGRRDRAVNGHTKPPSTKELSPFAEAMLRQTNFAHRYPTPVSPNEKVPTEASTSSKPASPKRKRSPQVSDSNAVTGPHIITAVIDGAAVNHGTRVLPASVSQDSFGQQPQARESPAQSWLTDNQTASTLNAILADRRSFQSDSTRPTFSTAIVESVPKASAGGANVSSFSHSLPPESSASEAHPISASNKVPSTSQVPGLLPYSSPASSPSCQNAIRRTPQSVRQQPMIVIPPPSAESRRPDYVTYDSPEIPALEEAASKNREGDADPSMDLMLSDDQRREAGRAVHDLYNEISDIFDADDELRPEMAEAQHAAYSEWFVAVSLGETLVNTLSAAVLARFEAGVNRVVAVRSFDDIPADDLQRIQGLCKGAITSAESLSSKVDPDWSGEEIAIWANQLDHMHLGLRSAQLVLKIMNGGHPNKQLYPEELLQVIARLIQGTIVNVVTIVEARSSGSQTAFFNAASAHKKAISRLLADINKVIEALVELVSGGEMAESVITPLEFCAIGLLFVENAPNEKDSLLGIQRFETLRRSAMDLITSIYANYPSQQSFLFMEILTSLQKLPTGRQAKRHYKLADGRTIQVVSALIMQLVQTIATSSVSVKNSTRSTGTNTQDDSDADGEGGLIPGKDHESNSADSEDASDEGGGGPGDPDLALQRLGETADSLCKSAAKSAQYAARYLVNRAQTSSKTGDQPHRQLLDIFVEDLLTVLSAPDWPAAELLLRALFQAFAEIIEDQKSLAPAKNMSLELLGLMGSAISELVSSTQQAAKLLANQESELSRMLSQMVTDYLEGSLDTTEILVWNSSYHLVIDFLHNGAVNEPHRKSAQGYSMAQWAKAASTNLNNSKHLILARSLRKMLLRTHFFSLESPEDISVIQSQVAYALTVLNLGLGRQFEYILQILLKSIDTEQTTVRSRALRSVTLMLDKDASLLDRSNEIKAIIAQCTLDSSSMVRDNALTLIAKCISLRPDVESVFINNILVLTTDPAVGVRKRTIRLLKEMYLRNSGKDIRARIANSLLQRNKDMDAGVTEVARQTFEDIWMLPFWPIPDLQSATSQDKISLRLHVGQMIRTAQSDEESPSALESLFQHLLSRESKNADANNRVCKSLVSTAFDVILDAGDNRTEQQASLLIMTIFAQAHPQLFSPDQLQILQPYIGNLSSTDDLKIFRSTVVVFRCVLPVLPTIQKELLRTIQTALLGSIQKLYKTEMNEVAQCLWKLNHALENPEKLINLNKSVLNKLYSMRNDQFADQSQQDNLKRMRKYIWIAGSFGKYCDFEAYRQSFQNGLPWWSPSGDAPVAGLIVQSLKPFTDAAQPMQLRVEALEGIGNVCHAWPRQFTQPHINKAFEDILQHGDLALQNVVLSSFRDFLCKIESQSAPKTGDLSLDSGAAANKPILGATVTANDDDGASTLIAQYFLKDVIRVALASQGDSALAATEVIASINRQGLAHPRASGSALVALETSRNSAIADVAFQGHRLLHQHHESALEQDYMRAVEGAFRYQKDLFKDGVGYAVGPSAKLKNLWEVIRSSVGKYQKKFLSNFCARIDFDIAKMDLSDNPPITLQYSRFLIENLAFFDYTRLDELLHAISCMEKVVAATGSSLAHSISTEIFHVTVEDDPTGVEDSTTSQLNNGESAALAVNEPPSSMPKIIDPARLYMLTTGSIILSALWEARTYLRRLYGQGAAQQRREGKIKAAKDLNKAPPRVQGVNGDKLVTSIFKMVASLDTEASMIEQCQKFVDLMKIDDEVKVSAESDEGSFERAETPGEGDNEDERDAPMSGSSRGHKRKGSASLAGTPSKKKRGRPPLQRSKSSRKSMGPDEQEDGGWA